MAYWAHGHSEPEHWVEREGEWGHHRSGGKCELNTGFPLIKLPHFLFFYHVGLNVSLCFPSDVGLSARIGANRSGRLICVKMRSLNA